MSAQIKALPGLRERLETATRHHDRELPRSANTTVRVGDIRDVLKDRDVWKQRALAAGYVPEPGDFYASITHHPEGRPPLQLEAGYAPAGFNDSRPYKVRQIIEGITHPVAGFPTQNEAFECLIAFVLHANKQTN